MAKELILYLLFLPLCYVLTLFTHELSHAIIAKLYGWDVKTFRPWPKIKDKKILYFGLVEVTGVGGVPSIFYIAPIIKYVTILPILIVLLIYIKWIFLLSLIVTETIDVVFWFSQLDNKNSDFYRWNKSRLNNE